MKEKVVSAFRPGSTTEGEEAFALMKKLFPICRSITGNGVRETLKIIKEKIPVEVHEVPSGTQVFDWTVPKEWNIKDAFVKDQNGNKIVDFKKLNLHVLNYSVPIKKTVSLKELKEHLHTMPEHPEWVPYLTSYYKENWGFCISYNEFEKLREGNYEVFIDSKLENGSLTYGELYIKGQVEDEILFSSYTCHPSMCDDNLTGVVVLVMLAKKLLESKHKYSYRFLFIPETIGAITWLSKNEDKVKNITAGVIAMNLGNKGNPTYKKSRQGNALIDKAVEKMLVDSGSPHTIIDFTPSYGSDERQFCSPGFNLPVGALMRSPAWDFPEYHTSADNPDFVSVSSLDKSFDMYARLIFLLENNETYASLNPKCEPQLGKRGLYGAIGARKSGYFNEIALLWVLNMCDGEHPLLDIAIHSKLDFEQIKNAADALVEKGLLKKA
ncbi:DUF4910 domain-containing protein [Candidatus Woesearchaeota archaeon]|nr:DUF4910 domain-containing protein [Candidatus Woesearchaeota archaeon]